MNFKIVRFAPQIIALVSLCTLSQAQADNTAIQATHIIKNIVTSTPVKAIGGTAAVVVALYALPIASKTASLAVNKCFKPLSKAASKAYAYFNMPGIAKFVTEFQKILDYGLEEDETISVLSGFCILYIGGIALVISSAPH